MLRRSKAGPRRRISTLPLLSKVINYTISQSFAQQAAPCCRLAGFPRFRSVEGKSGQQKNGFRIAAARRPESGVSEETSRPVSRVLSWTVIPLGLTSPSGSSNLPGSSAGHANAPLFGLAPSGVCHATRRCPRARCALTAPFHPYHARLATPFGGLFSVALSVGSRRPGVTWHCALWSPDFPRNACAPRDHPADSVGIVPR